MSRMRMHMYTVKGIAHTYTHVPYGLTTALPVVRCSVLQCVTVCYSVLRCVTVCCSVLQCVAVCCSVLQCVAVCCSVLRCVTVRCSVLQCVTVRCSVLQCVAVSYSAIQCVAMCCSVTYTCVPYRITSAHTLDIGWLQLVGSFKLYVSFAKEPCKRS